MPCDLVGRWRRSGWPGCRRLLRDLFWGLRGADGSPCWSRSGYLAWVWRAFIRKWLRAPWRCKLGRHRIGQKSDTGIGCCCAGGTMDIWCLDCDAALAVPLDDVHEWRKAREVLDLWRHRAEDETGANDAT